MGSLQETRGFVPANQNSVWAGDSSPNFQGVGHVPQAGAPLPRGCSCVEQPPSGPLWAPPCAGDTGTEVTRSWTAKGEGLVLGMSPGRTLRASAEASCGRHTGRPQRDCQGVNAGDEGAGRSVTRTARGAYVGEDPTFSSLLGCRCDCRPQAGKGPLLLTPPSAPQVSFPGGRPGLGRSPDRLFTA